MARPKIYSISSTKRSLAAEQSNRVKKYFLTMGIRTACFAGAIFTDGVIRWSLLGGSLILPWVAVVLANAAQTNHAESAEYLSLELNASQNPSTPE